jgi:recombination protein RecA
MRRFPPAILMSNSIDQAIAATEKVLGKDKVFKASQFLEETPRIPTGIFGLDLATGGGIPRGKITLIAGNESSCKSAMCYGLIADVQRQGQPAVLIDVEQSLTPSWAEVFGIDLDELVITYPSTLEEAYDVADALVYTLRPGILVFDSIAACSPDEEREKSFSEGERRAERAKLNNRFMRAMTSALKPYKGDDGKIRPADTAIVGIQHLYQDPSSPYFKEYMPAGISQKYLSMLTIYMKRRRWRVEQIIAENEDGGEDLKDERTVGLDVHWRVEKSKVSPAQREGEFTFFIENTLDGEYYQGQILETDHLVHIGRMWGIIRKNGAWYTMTLGGKEYKVQGTDRLVEHFEAHGDLFVNEVLTRMREESLKAREKPNRPRMPEGGINGPLDGEDEPATEEGSDDGEE